MFNKFFFCVIIAFSALHANAQSKPYFQQKVDTRINVMLDDVKHFLHGDIEMDYTNNSPDTLSFIYFHLYPNAYSSDRTAFEQQAVENGNTAHYLAKKKDWGFIDSLHFTADDMRAQVVTTSDVDVVKLLLPKALPPGASTKIATPFRVKIPLTFSRLGHSGQSYQISQWFPKPAVYDRKGWHQMPYVDQGEFYSEFGSYDVQITLPENYIVMATGNIATPTEQNWLDSLSKMSVTQAAQHLKEKGARSSATLKTVRFTENNVHDFAWFADKNWIVRKDTMTVPGTSSITDVYTAFSPNDSMGWSKSIQSVKNAVKLYSEWVGPYPYKTVKAVEGALTAGGGMEYPTVTVIAPSKIPELNNLVIVHEVGHNWFYGILGSNERLHPWLDEGVNSFYEKRTINATTEDDSLEERNTSIRKVFFDKMVSMEMLAFTQSMATRSSQPIGLRAEEFTNANYGGDVYGKSAAYLRWLREYMGETAFDNAMKDYYQQWKFKHPYPEDFEKIFKSHSSKNIDWFFEDGLNSSRGVDYKILGVKKQNGNNAVTIKNKTGFNAPVALKIDEQEKLYWSTPFTDVTTINIPEDFKTVQVAGFVPDYNLKNNRNKNIFSVKPFLGMSPTYDRTMWVMPALGYNVYDRFMLGAVLHNVTASENQFQYMIAPMYAFGSKTLVGAGVLSYAVYPQSSLIKEIDFNLDVKRYSFNRSNLNIDKTLRTQFLRVAPEVRFIFKKPTPRSPLERYLSVKGYFVDEQLFNFKLDPVDSLYRPSKGGSVQNIYGKIQYGLTNKRQFNPYSIVAEAQAGKDFAKLSLEGNLKIDYFYKNKGIHLRGFVGKMFTYGADYFATYRYQFAATYSGWNDYLYDNTFVGRNMQTTLAAQQIYIKEGGMKMPTLQYSNQIGLTDDWMAALNVKVDLPIGLPLQAYADFLTFSNAKTVNPEGSTLLYTAGLSLNISDMVMVNIPLLMSKEYSDYKTSILGKNSFWKTITFNIKLDKIYRPRLQRGIKLGV